eukprot:11459878-Karenia_brevis.AAC.1
MLHHNYALSTSNSPITVPKIANEMFTMDCINNVGPFHMLHHNYALPTSRGQITVPKIAND